MKTEVTTASGFACRLDEEEILDNYELLELLIRLDSGDRAALPAVLKLVLGDEQTAALKEHLRKENGKVATSAVHLELLEIFRAAKALKN